MPFRLFVPAAVLVVLSLFTDFSAADDAADVRAAALTAVRSAVSGRDMAAAKENLAVAAKFKGIAEYDAEWARLDELVAYVAEFWQAVERGAKVAEGTQELMIGGQLVSVVEYADATLVLRVAGQNRRYKLRDMPAKVALTLAQQVMQPEAPNNKVFFGSFLALDGKGDRGLAKQMWDDASLAKIDVRRLLPELEVPLAPPPIEIPPVSVPMRTLLSAKNWSLRTPGERVWVRKPLGNGAQQNSEGRLEVTIPADVGEQAQVVARRQFNGDFACNILFQNVKKSQTFGLFASDSGVEGYAVALPAGTVLLELTRQAGVVKCRVNHQDAEVQVLGKPAARMAGYIGLTGAAGDTFTIAAVEFSGR